MDNNKASQGKIQQPLPNLIPSLLVGLKELKENPNAQIIGNIDRGSFEILISTLTGTTDFTHTEGLSFMEERLNQRLNEDIPNLPLLNKTYDELKKQTALLKKKVNTYKGFNLKDEEINKFRNEMLLRSKAFTATVVSLPKELSEKQGIIRALSRDILGTGKISQESIPQTVTSSINTVINKENKNEQALVGLTSQRAARMSLDKDKQFQSIILGNLKRLQKYPLASNLGGIPYESFEMLVRSLTGKSDLKLSNPKSLKEAISAISALDRTSLGYKTSMSVYEMLKRHQLQTRLKLEVPKGSKRSQTQEALALRFMPDQMFLVTVLTQLPPEISGDPLFQSHLEAELKDYDIASDKFHQKSVTEKVESALKKSGKTVPKEQLQIVSQNTTKNINKVIPKGIPLWQVAASVALSISSFIPRDGETLTGDPQLDRSLTAEQMENEDSFDGLGMGVGGLLGITKYGKPKAAPQGEEESFVNKEMDQSLNAQKEERQKQQEIKPETQDSTQSSTPVNIETATNQAKRPILGFISNLGINLKKGIGNVAKSLRNLLLPGGWIGKIGGLFSGLLNRGSQNLAGLPAAANEISNMGLIATVIFFVTIGLLVFGTDTKKASAFVTQITGCDIGRGGLTPIQFGDGTCPVLIAQEDPTPTPLPTIPTTPTPIEDDDGEPSLPSSLPQGFPLDTSCVTQRPGASFSHRNLNAIDMVVLGNSPQNWTIRATHDGIVSFAGCGSSCTTGYGYYAMIRSTNNQFLTLYGHMQLGSLKVKAGDGVTRGQPIGIVNDTGFSTANHLHYELRAISNIYFNQFGRVGTILNYLPSSSNWQCNI